jgi:PAS domain S-box-containing protein
MIYAMPASSDEELAREAAKAGLLLEAARYLGETLDPERVYDRFREILADAVQHDGVVVSSFDERDDLIRCDYAWVEGERLDPAIFPPVELNRSGGGMQSRVIVSGEPLLVNDVGEQVKREGTYYDVDRAGTVRKVPESGPPGTQAAMMVPIRHEGRVVGVVQLMSDRSTYSLEQLELAEALVGQMAAAARNARLHAAVQAEARARVRAEEERARLEAAQAAAEAAAAEREAAARVLEAVGDGIMLVDDAGIVRFWNRAAELLTGLPGARVRNRLIADAFAHWETVAEQVEIADGEAAPRPATVPLDVDGRELWLSFVAVRSSEGVVYAFRDLTLERELDTAKSDFIATVSHELRTPMTAVLGAAKTLLREDLQLSAEQTRQLLEMIATQATRLSQVTEEVLLASSLDRGDVRLEMTPIELEEVVREVVHALEPQLSSTTSLVVRLERPACVLGDRDRVVQVLLNLIDNAVKYSPEGGTVTVSTRRLHDSIRVCVEDEGSGIPPPEQERIFEKFYRRDPQLRRTPSGTGLGLYICRELVRRMGGRIGVNSREGAGSTFFFELSAADGAEAYAQ